MNEDGKIKWNCLHYPIPEAEIGSNPQQDGWCCFAPALQQFDADCCPTAQYSAILAGLTMAISTASINQMTYDDILAIARQFGGKPRT